MLHVGQEFKNYREICKYLKEEEKTGRSKELQLKRWQLSFSWHKEGHKFVIDEVYRDYVRKGTGGNRKHLDAFLPYVIYWLKVSGVKNEYIGTQRMMKSELKLIPSEMYEVYNHRARDHTEYLYKHGLTSYESLLKFIHYFEVYANETLEGCFRELKRGGGIIWSPGQIFVMGLLHREGVYTTGYEEVLDDIETSVCNEMNTGDELKGRQYLHVIKRDPELMESFYKECIRRLLLDEKLIEDIKQRYKKKYKRTFIPQMLKKYYRVYYIGEIKKDVLRKWKLPDKIDGIRLKKAFVNPVGQEMQMLKKKVYEDIFQRMGSKNKKTNNKLGIPDTDFETLKFLVVNYPEHNQKLTTKDYSPRKSKKQGRNEDGDIRTEAIEN